MRKALLISLLLTGLGLNAQPRSDLDSILASLHNNDLYVAPVLRGVDLFPQTGAARNISSCPQRPQFIVSSLNVDIRELADKYPAKTVVQKLIGLLEDSTRDFYANALLYDLLDNRNLVKLLFMKREEWINTGRKTTDTQYWQLYIIESTPGVVSAIGYFNSSRLHERYLL
jgi:hypothetical protein